MQAYAANQRAAGRFHAVNTHLWKVSQWLTLHHIVSPQSGMLVNLAFALLAVCLINTLGILLAKFLRGAPIAGVRRALGARRRDIEALFLAENALVVSAGAILGCLLALAIGQWLTDHDGVARLDPWYLVIGVAVLALTSQLAAWQPARRAARIPPSVATRTI